MASLSVSGVVTDAATERGLAGLRIAILLGKTPLGSATSGADGAFTAQLTLPATPALTRPTTQLKFQVTHGGDTREIAKQKITSRAGQVAVQLAVKGQAQGTEPTAPRLPISSYAELVQNEREILRRIEALPNGGNLFMIHPFLLLADVGVELSERARTEILRAEPRLAGLSAVPYRALRASRSPQTYQIRLRGLFERRSL
jgi:hypothetical protein